MKLPDEKYKPKHCKKLYDYARGWNYGLEKVADLVMIYDEYEDLKEDLLALKEYALKRKEEPFYKGECDCIVEFEKLNEEAEWGHKLDNFFQNSLEALDKLNINGEQRGIIVIDKIPSCCIVCRYYDKGSSYYSVCKIAHKKVTSLDDDKHTDSVRQTWCPIKPLPKKLEENTDDEYDYEWLYKRGYNDCIKDILKEEK